MKYYKTWLICCCILLWLLVSRFDASYGYFEYKYYCDLTTSSRITITLKPTETNERTCLSYLKTLDENITAYTQQIKNAQANLTTPSEFTAYRQSYLDTMQPRLLQARVSQTQILKAMEKFETDLFYKTMIYMNYRYKTVRQNLTNNIARRERALTSAILEWDNEAVQRINKKYRNEKLKLEIINLMLSAKNFNEFMPFYTMYKQWEFDY